MKKGNAPQKPQHTDSPIYQPSSSAALRWLLVNRTVSVSYLARSPARGWSSRSASVSAHKTQVSRRGSIPYFRSCLGLISLSGSPLPPPRRILVDHLGSTPLHLGKLHQPEVTSSSLIPGGIQFPWVLESHTKRRFWCSSVIARAGICWDIRCDACLVLGQPQHRPTVAALPPVSEGLGCMLLRGRLTG